MSSSSKPVGNNQPTYFECMNRARKENKKTAAVALIAALVLLGGVASALGGFNPKDVAVYVAIGGGAITALALGKLGYEAKQIKSGVQPFIGQEEDDETPPTSPAQPVHTVSNDKDDASVHSEDEIIKTDAELKQERYAEIRQELKENKDKIERYQKLLMKNTKTEEEKGFMKDFKAKFEELMELNNELPRNRGKK